jgi:hypothetical protein
MALTQNYRVSVVIDGVSRGVWDTFAGGEVTGVVVKRRSGGMGPIKQSSGLPDYADVTVTKEHDPALYRALVPRASKAEMSVNVQPLDANGQAFSKPTTYVGKLLNVTPPGTDSMGTDDAMMSATMSVRSVA